MSQLADIPIKGFGDIFVDEAAGNFSFEVKGTVLGTPEDFTFNLPIAQVLAGLAAGITNPILKWALTFVISML